MNILIKYTIIVLVFAKKLTILVSIEATRVKITKKKKKIGAIFITKYDQNNANTNFQCLAT
jgi:hypothetical protein